MCVVCVWGGGGGRPENEKKEKSPLTLAAAASIRLMFPSESALGSAGVPPIVETTRSTSSICAKAFSTSSFDVASPRTTTAIIRSISGRRTSERCSIQTQAPASLRRRATERATPPPPATRTEALSGSMSPAAVARGGEAREGERRGGEGEGEARVEESGDGCDKGAGRRELCYSIVSCIRFFGLSGVAVNGEGSPGGIPSSGLRACAGERVEGERGKQDSVTRG